jgi:hypothetical protein
MVMNKIPEGYDLRKILEVLIICILLLKGSGFAIDYFRYRLANTPHKVSA